MGEYFTAIMTASDSGTAESLHLRGIELAAGGYLDDAREAIACAYRIDSTRGEYCRDLAAVYGAGNDWRKAAELYEQATHRLPAAAGLDNDWARALIEAGRPEDAIDVLSRLNSPEVKNARTHYLLGRAYLAVGRAGDAYAAWQRTLDLNPDFAPAHLAIYGLLGSKSHYHAARQGLANYVRLRPDDIGARSKLVTANWHCGDLSECLALCEELRERGIASLNLESFYRVARIHHFGETAGSLRGIHEEWNGCAPAVEAWDGWADRDKSPERVLRIGFVANQFASGPFFHFVTPLFRDRNRDEFRLYCYHTCELADAQTAKLKSMSDHWLQETEAAALAKAIEADQIDILVDMSGHYGRNLPLFQVRRAPLQLALPTEYPCTTGLASIDRILTDRWACPDGQEEQYTERPHFLPGGYLTYSPPPAVPVLPRTAGRITFGLFQRPTKLNPVFWNLTCKILDQTPGSELLIHFAAAELDEEDSGARIRCANELRSRGLAPERLRFRGSAALTEHLAVLSEADIALDSFPYNGQTTTCECLWMGVPVITLAGSTHVSRVGCTILSQMRLANLVAASEEEYVELAVSLAKDRTTLADLRRTLRERVLQSPMVDGTAVRGIEFAFRELWREYCGKQRSQPEGRAE